MLWDRFIWFRLETSGWLFADHRKLHIPQNVENFVTSCAVFGFLCRAMVRGVSEWYVLQGC